jgi:phosphatidylinositol dimannoside acyltransferase
VRRSAINNMLPLVDDDIRRARRASRAVFRSVASYYAELVTLPGTNMVEYDRQSLVVENEHFLAAVMAPEPVVIVSAHMGNPELAIQALVVRGRPFAALVETLHPRDFAEEMLRLRRAGGGLFFESTVSGLKGLLRHLELGGLVGLVGDRDIAGNGVPVTLCGRDVRVSAIPWEIARRTGATVVPAFSLRRRHGTMVVTLGEPFRVAQSNQAAADKAEAAQRWAVEFERQLKRAPAQWYVMEDFWNVHEVRADENNAMRGRGR